MSPAPQADALVTAIDVAEARSAGVGRAVSEGAEDLDAVARCLGAGAQLGLAGLVAGGGWFGRSGARARGHVAVAAADARMLAGACLFLSDVLRVEGARLARAIINWDDDDKVHPGSGDHTEVIDADQALTQRLREAADALAGAIDPDIRPCIDVSGTTDDDPRAIAELWHSLGPTDRERLARDNPELGSVAGLPSATRDAINRTRLSRLLDALDGGVTGGGRAGLGRGAAADLAEAGPGLVALADYLDEDPSRHLLSLHADGRAVVASGNPDSADRVVTLVPGTGSSLADVDRTGDRAASMCEAAESTEPAATESSEPVDAGTEACVSVAWQGYDAPDSIIEAGRSLGLARAHAEDLRTFTVGVDAVEAMDGDDAPHTVVGYSYGSATLGAAASDPRGLAADRMIHVGSPGAAVDSIAEQWVNEGSSHESATSRRASDDEVVGVASRWDAVPWWSIVGVLGERPGTDDFGGLSVDVAEPGAGPSSVRDSHSTYFDRGTVSLSELGKLIADTD